MRVEEGFQQTAFADDSPYTSDPVLQGLLKRLLPDRVHREVDLDLKRFEQEVVTNVRSLGDISYPPSLTQYDQWGKRVDHLHTSEGWKGLKAFAQKEGIVSIAYERKQGEYSRIFGFVKMALMTGDAQVIFCPLGMTDGCARVLELYGNPAVQKDVLPRVISRDPAVAFTSGQWMTERPGGSDVSQTETVATALTESASPYGPKYKLDGFKWFSSATDSNVSVALARTGTLAQGSRGLSLFLVPLRVPLLRGPADPLPPSTSNNIFVHRLKKKFGTQIVPTAELSINGAEAYLLGPENQGVKCITPVLAITRIYSAVASVGALRKCLAIARSFSTVRTVNGGRQLLSATPLHVAELAKVSLVYRALAHMLFGAIHLLGKTECGTATPEEELRLRLLTPIVKGFAAEKAVPAMEECMAALGGQGYMEENYIARLIRDGLVEKIWEGTVTVLSLDLIRSMQVKGAQAAFTSWAEGILATVPSILQLELKDELTHLQAALKDLQAAYAPPIQPLIPRPALFLFSYVTSSLYLLEHAVWSYQKGEAEKDIDIETFKRWISEGGLDAAQEELNKARAAPVTRSASNAALVYGAASAERSKL
ncbi:acyl-CoA dehydrogenase/oxidase C-terminal [Dentipellis sp. KUC8613]|nr:acyl-CoA dehydrogenase/oxidase C-terminal [Dentipellis sp. KUC8613]